MPPSPASAMLGIGADAAGPARADRCGEDGHHGRHQRAAGAQGRPHAAAWSIEASPTRCASATRRGRGCSICDIMLPELLYEQVVEVGGRVGARRREVVSRWTKTAPRASLDRGPRRRHRGLCDRADACLEIPRA